MVSFSGVTGAGPFYEQIWNGHKRQTMRKARSDGRPHVKPGHSFTMYWRCRQPKDSKPVHYIGKARCTGYEPICLVEVWGDEEFAKRDGFASLEEFHDWFIPDWRRMPWLKDHIELYQSLREDLPRERALADVSNLILEHLLEEYRLIKWNYPLIERGERKG